MASSRVGAAAAYSPAESRASAVHGEGFVTTVTKASAPPATDPVAASRKLIRSGEVDIEVANYPPAAARVLEIARSNGGYVAESRVTRGSGDKLHGVLTVRVRADRFDEAFASMKALGKVQSEAVSTQDITKAYSDLETRLRVKRDAEARMRRILLTKTAKLADIVAAERELTRLIEEIEQMERERRFYDQQVALSTITPDLHEPEAIVREGSFAPVRRAFHDSLEALSTSLAALLYAVFYAAPWVLLTLVLWRLWRRGRRRRARPSERPE